MHSVPVRLLSLFALALLAACAQQQPTHSTAGALEGRRASLKCPAGMTMMCETKRIGRIQHGTFARANDYCACVPEGMRPMESPVIPAARQ